MLEDPQSKKRNLKMLFLVIAVISCFTCYARADFNLPLFAFAYLLWDQTKPRDQKTRLIYLFIFTWIFDFVWLVYWGGFWQSDKFNESWAKGVQSFVLVLSIINFIIKLGVIIYSWIVEDQCKRALSPDEFIRNIKGIFSVDNETHRDVIYFDLKQLLSKISIVLTYSKASNQKSQALKSKIIEQNFNSFDLLQSIKSEILGFEKQIEQFQLTQMLVYSKIQ